MSHTREKLNEAKYFLARMRDTESDREAFAHNLSAYMTAARSVTDIIRTEFSGSPGFDSWWSQRLRALLTDPLVAAVKDRRDISVHRRPVRPRAHVTASISSRVAVSSQVTAIVTRADGTTERIEAAPHVLPTDPPPEATGDRTSVEWRWYFAKLSQGETSERRQQLIKLQKDGAAADAVIAASELLTEQTDVLGLCEQLAAQLESLVSECEQRFMA